MTYNADILCQYKFILVEKEPFIITIKCVRYMQNETLANEEKNLCPSINFTGSFLHPNIAEKVRRKIPIMKITLKILL